MTHHARDRGQMMGRRTVNRSITLGFLAILIGIILAGSACSSSDGGSRIPRASSSPTVPTEPPPRSVPTTTAQSVGDAPADLHDVDWATIPIPGEFCGVPGLVTFTDNEATGTSDKWGPVHLSRVPDMVYGDITGDRRSEAAVNVQCDNGGGTASGQLAFAFVVFEGAGGRLTTIGTVTPQKNPPSQHVTLLTKVQLRRGHVIAHELWYRPGDGTCCPTGTAVTTWKLQDGQLTAGAPHITS
jgi:hypothetical protein